MWDPQAEARRWLEQAQYDLAFARYALEGEHFNQVCFISQQSAEKAVKAVAYGLGARRVIGHSIVDLIDRFCAQAPDLARLREQAATLDVHYVPARYPNGLPGGVPFTTYTRSMAEAAVKAAAEVVAVAEAELGDSADGG